MNERNLKTNPDPRIDGLNSIRTISAVEFWNFIEKLADEFLGEGYHDISAQTIAEELIKGFGDILEPEKDGPVKIAAFIKQNRNKITKRK